MALKVRKVSMLKSVDGWGIHIVSDNVLSIRGFGRGLELNFGDPAGSYLATCTCGDVECLEKGLCDD